MPVGIVVIPASHNIYNDGTPGVMALKNLSSAYGVRGAVNDEVILNNYAQVINDMNNGVALDGTTMQSPKSYSYLLEETSSTRYIIRCPGDEACAWPFDSYSDGPFIASPYYNGGPNPLYGAGSTNVFKKYHNRKNIFASTFDRTYNWKVTGEIDDNTKIKNAWAHSWRFTTPGTHNGDWYLPTAYEMGYVYVRKQTLTNTFNALNKKRPNSCDLFKSEYYLTGTQTNFNGYSPELINFATGYCNVNGSSTTVRPFRPFFNIVINDEGDVDSDRPLIAPAVEPDSYADDTEIADDYSVIFCSKTSWSDGVQPLYWLNAGVGTADVMGNNKQLGITDPTTDSPRKVIRLIYDAKYACGVTNGGENISDFEQVKTKSESEEYEDYNGPITTWSVLPEGAVSTSNIYATAGNSAPESGPATPNETTQALYCSYKLPKDTGLSIWYTLCGWGSKARGGYPVTYDYFSIFQLGNGIEVETANWDGWYNYVNYNGYVPGECLGIANAPTSESFLNEIEKFAKHVTHVCINFKYPDDPINQEWIARKPSNVRIISGDYTTPKGIFGSFYY